jgi:ADP-heptose:LPS heptosyltransferase
MIQPENLLIVRTDRIGDVILSLPLASIIKKHLSECKITFLVRDYTKEIVNNHPYIDNTLTLNEENAKISLISNIKKISRFNFDTAIIVYPTFITALIIFLCRIKNRIGTGYRWYSFLFNHKIYEHRKYAERHELEFNVNFLTKFGIKEDVNPGNVNFYLKPKSESIIKVEKILSDSEIDTESPIIIIHPGSGGSSVDLPQEKFKLLAGKIFFELTENIILTGNTDEYELCEKLRINTKILNLAGKLDLSEMVALVSKCSVFIANSTGPIHIAASLDKYTIGFYPQIPACSAKRWGPYSYKSVVFSPKLDCSECTREQCVKLNCMSSIEVNDVFYEIEKIYKFILAEWRN